MVTKREVLDLIAERSRKDRHASYRSLVRNLDVSEDAACMHLLRLWQARLIKPISYRPEGAEYKLRRAEGIRELEFRLTKRGAERLTWYAAQERDDWGW